MEKMKKKNTSVIISLDRNAYEILKNIKEELRKQGITASFSDAVRHLIHGKKF